MSTLRRHADALLSCLVAVLAFPLVTGCAASGPVYVDALPPQEGDALVYIYRNKSFAAGATVPTSTWATRRSRT